MLLDPLRLPSFDKINVSDEDADPRQESKYRHEVDKVREHFSRVIGYIQECNAGDSRTQPQRVDGNPSAIRTCEYFGRIPLLGQTVEGSRGDVQIRVGCREDEDEDARIEEPWETGDSTLNHSNDEG